MKISTFSQPVGFTQRVREKRENDGEFERQLKFFEQKDEKESENPQDSPQEQDPERLEAAIEGFAADEDARSSGLSAVVAGAGPGLRVVLKDAYGGVVRQFTGEEFLKLRDAVRTDMPTRGKILDQKL